MAHASAVQYSAVDAVNIDSARNTSVLPKQDDGSDDPRVQRIITESLRTLRYGTLILTIHEGRLVEISKTVRYRFTK
jgi:hypothetical protein